MIDEKDHNISIQQRLINKINGNGSPTEEIEIIIFSIEGKEEKVKELISKDCFNYEEDEIEDGAYIAKTEVGKLEPLINKLDGKAHIIEIS